MKVELKQQFRIESARLLPHLDEGHPCRNIHGHSFVITLRLIGHLDEQKGWLKDYHEIKTLMTPLLTELDHRILNQIPGLENPTSENIAIYIYQKARTILPELVQVSVSETPDTECSFPIF